MIKIKCRIVAVIVATVLLCGCQTQLDGAKFADVSKVVSDFVINTYPQITNPTVSSIIQQGNIYNAIVFDKQNPSFRFNVSYDKRYPEDIRDTLRLTTVAFAEEGRNIQALNMLTGVNVNTTALFFIGAKHETSIARTADFAKIAAENRNKLSIDIRLVYVVEKDFSSKQYLQGLDAFLIRFLQEGSYYNASFSATFITKEQGIENITEQYLQDIMRPTGDDVIGTIQMNDVPQRLTTKGSYVPNA